MTADSPTKGYYPSDFLPTMPFRISVAQAEQLRTAYPQDPELVEIASALAGANALFDNSQYEAAVSAYEAVLTLIAALEGAPLPVGYGVRYRVPQVDASIQHLLEATGVLVRNSIGAIECAFR